MLMIYYTTKDYEIKLPHQIKRGTQIVFNHNIYTFLSYQQGKGMENNLFGEYGLLKMVGKDTVYEETVFEHSPIVCVKEV